MKEKTLLHPDKINYSGAEEFEKWDQLIGLLSLSEDPINILMWSHYSDNHKGFVVGFETDWLLGEERLDFIDRVEYSTDCPYISGFSPEEDKFRKRFFVKSKLWSYEKEWRATKNHIEGRILVFPKSAVKSVVLGCEMPVSDQESVAALVADRFPRAAIYCAKKSERKFTLELHEQR